MIPLFTIKFLLFVKKREILTECQGSLLKKGQSLACNIFKEIEYAFGKGICSFHFPDCLIK